jgi:hypothetical protein
LSRSGAASFVAEIPPSGDVTGATDTAAIQALLDAGQDVLLGDGDWRVTQLVMRNGTSLRGRNRAAYGLGLGATLMRQVAGVNKDVIVFEPSPDDATFTGPWAMSDFIIDASNATSTAGCGINVATAAGVGMKMQDNTELARITVFGAFADGFRFNGVTPGNLEDLNAFFNGGYGYRFIDDGSQPPYGRLHHISLLNLSGDGNKGGAVVRVENATATAGMVITGLKSERRDNPTRVQAAAQPHVIEFDNCQNSVVINGLTSIAKGSELVRIGDIINITGAVKPTITWAGVGWRLIAAQVGALPLLIKDNVGGRDVPLSRSGHFGPATPAGFRSGLYLDGTGGNYASCPDAAALDLATKADIRMLVAPADWTPAGTVTLLGKYNAGTNQRSYQVQLLADGRLQFIWSTDGLAGTVTGDTMSAAVPDVIDGVAKWLRITFDGALAGNTQHQTKFYTSDDGVAWTLLQTVTVAAPVVIFPGTAVLAVGSDSTGGSPLTGTIFQASVRSVIDAAAPVAEVDFTGAPNPRYRDRAGNVWSYTGAAYAFVRD